VEENKKKRHITIPIFIPGEACPFQCIFCDQKKITGASGLPGPEEIREIIHRNLSTIIPGETTVEAGFFGGTFTGLSFEDQEKCFKAVEPFIMQGKIDSIRLSTRPDYISPEIMDFLKRFPVRTIELGAQSMDDSVLLQSRRGHLAADTEKASGLILSYGFRLGLQMMIGLPGDTKEKSALTAREIIRQNAHETRIYPVVVIRGTALEYLFKQGKYQPLSLEEAVSWTKEVVNIFDDAGVKVIRIGLHPSEGLLSKADLVAGPFHPSFRELVMTEIWHDRFAYLLSEEQGKNLTLTVNPSELNAAIGYNSTNRNALEKKYRSVKFTMDHTIIEKTFHADHH
jgi:histone acetyltransferase (RNA polymerase elongator complex component)